MNTNFLHKILSFLAIVTLTLMMTFGWSDQLRVLAEPLTPEAAKYEIDQSATPEEAGRRVQAQAKAHKEEIKEGAKPVQEAAKSITENSQNVFQRVVERVQETLKPDDPNSFKTN